LSGQPGVSVRGVDPARCESFLFFENFRKLLVQGAQRLNELVVKSYDGFRFLSRLAVSLVLSKAHDPSHGDRFFRVGEKLGLLH